MTCNHDKPSLGEKIVSGYVSKVISIRHSMDQRIMQLWDVKVIRPKQESKHGVKGQPKRSGDVTTPLLNGDRVRKRLKTFSDGEI
ncbi:hypothetical protein TNCV_636011 [Trichonephila clavipes]|nr:hypothetical protein TNCV_636011 [Trichonephila clavipes]